MTLRDNPDPADMIAGAIDWWLDAGVDCAFQDDPVNWLAPEQPDETTAKPIQDQRGPAPSAPAETSQPSSKPAAPRIALAELPATLEAFAPWWLAEPMLADGPLTARIAPRGTANAELMVIVPEPEREDRDNLLCGPQGRLLDAMLSAFGIAEQQVYVASAIPRHLPGADWDALAAAGVGDALRHHIALAAPRRIAVFGASVLPLIGHAPPQGPADLRIFNHESMKVRMLACRSLAALLEQPRWKARIWQAWLEMND